MTQDEKAKVYDECLRQSDILQRTNSKLKSEYFNNMPPDIQKIIDENERKIAMLVQRLENLFR